jgi:hypothetical protein
MQWANPSTHAPTFFVFGGVAPQSTHQDLQTTDHACGRERGSRVPAAHTVPSCVLPALMLYHLYIAACVCSVQWPQRAGAKLRGDAAVWCAPRVRGREGVVGACDLRM